MGPHVDARKALGSQVDAYLRAPASAAEMREAPGLNPEDVFAFAAQYPMPVYLWGDGVHPRGRYSIITHSPYATICSRPGGATLSRGLHRLQVPLDGEPYVWPPTCRYTGQAATHAAQRIQCKTSL